GCCLAEPYAAWRQRYSARMAGQFAAAGPAVTDAGSRAYLITCPRVITRCRDFPRHIYDARMYWVLVFALVAACHDDDYLAFTGEPRQVLCSAAIDDLTQDAPWDLIHEQIRIAASHDWVVMFHAHIPDVTITRGAIETVLALAQSEHVDFVTFRDL